MYCLCLLHSVVSICHSLVPLSICTYSLPIFGEWSTPTSWGSTSLLLGNEGVRCSFPAHLQLKHRHDPGPAKKMHLTWESQSVKIQRLHKTHSGKVMDTSRWQSSRAEVLRTSLLTSIGGKAGHIAQSMSGCTAVFLQSTLHTFGSYFGYVASKHSYLMFLYPFRIFFSFS